MRPWGPANTGENSTCRTRRGRFVPHGEVPRELIIAPAADHKFDFVLAVDRLEIVHRETCRLRPNPGISRPRFSPLPAATRLRTARRWSPPARCNVRLSAARASAIASGCSKGSPPVSSTSESSGAGEAGTPGHSHRSSASGATFPESACTRPSTSSMLIFVPP